MSPPHVVTIKCLVYRNTSQLWVADTKDIPDCKVTTMSPEDSLRRFQTVALERLASQIMYDTIPLSSSVQVNINSSVVSQEDAERLLGSSSFSYDDDDLRLGP